MENFKYKVTVIVPMYNSADYIDRTVNSLIGQTIFPDIEVLLVDDGSSDGSLESGRRYADTYSNIFVLPQEHGGVSRARNTGMSRAAGKYIMFLDADDEYEAATVESVYEYFETVYDEVNVVAYPERKFVDGKSQKIHFRYEYLKNTGIYDLNEFIYIAQSRINIAIKNQENKEYFDCALSSAEDQEFVGRLLAKDMKLGFTAEGMYRYNQRAGGVSSAGGYVFYVADVLDGYYKKMFAPYPGQVPAYFQAMFLYDINWKIRKDQLWPYHYDTEKFARFKEDLIKLLKRCDLQVIMKHPALDLFHKFYLLKLMGRPVQVIAETQKLRIVCGGEILQEEERLLIVVTQLKICGGKLKILGHLKSPAYAFTDKPGLYALADGETRELELFESTAGRYKSKMKTNLFWGFYFEEDADKLQEVSFRVDIDGVCYGTKFYFMPYTPIDLENKYLEFYDGDILVEFKNQAFYVRKLAEEELLEKLNVRNRLALRNGSGVYRERKAFDMYRRKKIWLYYDCRGVDYDNGYYQFINDFDRNDGITRYYINNNAVVREGLFQEKHKRYIVPFGSTRHRKLFLNADKILTAYVEKNNVYPFSAEEFRQVKDLVHFETVYLQHGILHASIPWKYTPESLQIDKVVVSSGFEISNFIEHYNFRRQDIYPVGMPRLDALKKTGAGKGQKGRILFAPSWRNYLIMPQLDNYWEPLPEIFMESDYYKGLSMFLHSEKLETLLEQNDMFLDFKLHPIFREAYGSLFSWKSKRICFADNVVDSSGYDIFVTDFSSYVFDFVYLEIPVVYFVPDYLQFKSGMNQYREMDLPFEDAFGPFVTGAEEAAAEIAEIIKTGNVPKEKYLNRMRSFFISGEHRAEALYREIMAQGCGPDTGREGGVF